MPNLVDPKHRHGVRQEGVWLEYGLNKCVVNAYYIVHLFSLTKKNTQSSIFTANSIHSKRNIWRWHQPNPSFATFFSLSKVILFQLRVNYLYPGLMLFWSRLLFHTLRLLRILNATLICEGPYSDVPQSQYLFIQSIVYHTRPRYPVQHGCPVEFPDGNRDRYYEAFPEFVLSMESH